ncbi:hypothetical protein PMIN06_012964 [Paraphaeosphaeria minitans]|uniref:Uncharacterized protein n=1 Tax=Paraphaeosphaeria minitans TaxID=565426 RepID=A0A9P6KR73_9PLEO|nr:hypothetical protein PMIN01_05807 [Paraphaeosphaeria minitans]
MGALKRSAATLALPKGNGGPDPIVMAGSDQYYSIEYDDDDLRRWIKKSKVKKVDGIFTGMARKPKEKTNQGSQTSRGK